MLPILAIGVALLGFLLLMSRKDVTFHKGIVLVLIATVGISFLIGLWLDSKVSYTLIFEWAMTGPLALKIGAVVFLISNLLGFTAILDNAVRSGQLVD